MGIRAGGRCEGVAVKGSFTANVDPARVFACAAARHRTVASIEHIRCEKCAGDSPAARSSRGGESGRRGDGRRGQLFQSFLRPLA